MIKRWFGLLAVVWLMACGSGSETSATGGAGGEGGTGGGGTTITGLGGTGGDTASGGVAGAGGMECKVPQPAECAPVDADATLYDPLAAYDEMSPIVGYVTAIPDTPEVGHAAAGALLGPWAIDRTFTGMSVVLKQIGGALPDPVTLAVWTEELCGLPTDDPHMHEVDVPLANFTGGDEIGAGNYWLVWTFDEPFTVPAGATVATALTMTDLTVGIATYKPLVADKAPFSVWWGITDNNCDGAVDPNLGWAKLAKPTAKGVTPYPFDEAFALIE